MALKHSESYNISGMIKTICVPCRGAWMELEDVIIDRILLNRKKQDPCIFLHLLMSGITIAGSAGAAAQGL